MQRRLEGALEFIRHEAAGGMLLLAVAILAVVFANSPAAGLYDAFLGTPVKVQVGALKLDKPLLLWINDGLMAIFFFLVGLEVKRELMVGELSTPRRAALPAVAALGGIVVPALIYAAVNIANPQGAPGWAIPAATDIAFAVGVLAMVGSGAPTSLKIFLLALAIIDDLGAIIIIALFYTSDLSTAALILAGVGLVVLFALNRSGVISIAPYVLVGLFIWVCVLKSGVHATLAGVATAFAVPLTGGDDTAEGPLERLEHSLHPWVTYAILPLFAFANAGVDLAGFTLAKVFGPIPLGIILGLVIGKPLGIFGATYAAVRFGLVDKPEGTTWMQLLGVSMLGGIGFTMSLFIGMLAFPDPAFAADIRIGVLLGSIISAVLGYIVLKRHIAPQPEPS
jgi:NhaA family Na+:H+ antiporter